jgi:hypothetical protein
VRVVNPLDQITNFKGVFWSYFLKDKSNQVILKPKRNTRADRRAIVAMVSAFKPYRKSVLNRFAPEASGGPPMGAAINKYTKINSVPMKKATGVDLVSVI